MGSYTGSSATAALAGALGHLLAADVAACTRSELDGLVARAQRLRSWLDAFDVKVAVRAAELAAAGRSEPAADVLTNSGRQSRKHGEHTERRSRACTAVPGLGEALEAGRLSGEHVDAIANCADGLDAAGRAKLGELAEEVIASAAALPVEQFARECRNLAAILSRDGGTTRQQRCRQARRVRRWVDRQTGMCKTLVELDAEADARMWTAINAAVDDSRRQHTAGDDRTFEQLQADAVVELITGARGVEPRVPEVSVLIDVDTLRQGTHGRTTCETFGGEALDVETVRRLGCGGDLVTILLDGDGRPLNVGRARRLATRAQRQALRAMYRTCSFPGCDTSFDRCQIHHVDWWAEHHGGTDLDSLTPLCHLHHHLVHDAGWRLTVASDRTLTVHRPDGTVHFHGDTTDRRGRSEAPVESAGPAPGPDQPGRAPLDDLRDELADALARATARIRGRPPPSSAA